MLFHVLDRPIVLADFTDSRDFSGKWDCEAVCPLFSARSAGCISA